jgi:hypothetical protein
MRKEFELGETAWLTNHTAWAPYIASEHPEVWIAYAGERGTGLASYYDVRVRATGELITHVHEDNLLRSDPHKRALKPRAPRPAPQEESLF